MNEEKFTADELELSSKILDIVLRDIVSENSFLQRPVFALRREPTAEIGSICADYTNLYYDPKWVIKRYSDNKLSLITSIIHVIIHCLYLHPSMKMENQEVFDTAADFSILMMAYESSVFNITSRVYDMITSFRKRYPGSKTTAELYKLAADDPTAFSKMFSIVEKMKLDDHSLWYTKKKDSPEQAGQGGRQDQGEGGSSVAERSEAAANEIRKAENEWRGLLYQADAAKRSEGHGSLSGDSSFEIEKPERFSRFSYLEYLRRFAAEGIEEDMDTLDLAMYNWGMENLGDIPIIEFSEVKENCVPSDIIIAVDVSGSCCGEVAENFLRQVYSLFEQLNLRGTVNINVVTFDTEILSSTVIKSRNDANSLVNNFPSCGWGGTDFECVFDYAKELSEKKRVKALFFFSDGDGRFPDDKPKIPTAFFVPGFSPKLGSMDFSDVPEWVDLVLYND